MFSTFQLIDQFTLDFDRVPLGQKSRLELIIVNLTDIESGIKANIAKFKARVRHFFFNRIFFLFYKFFFSLYHLLMDKVRKMIGFFIFINSLLII
jgi:hypothetical protein